MANERRDDSAVLGMLQSVLNDVAAMRKELSDHIIAEPAEIAEAVRVAIEDVVAQAFPVKDDKPDLAGHKNAHQEMIDAYRAKKEFWQKMLFELTRWSLIGFALWTLKAVVEHAAHTIAAAAQHVK